MNTKSMILALNSLLIFNTVNPWFGISSWRKKLVNTCTSLGKKSISVFFGMALAVLSTFGLKGGYFGSKLNRAAHMASHNSRPFQGPQFVPPVTRPHMPPHDPGPVPDPVPSELRARKSSALTSKLHRAVPLAAISAASASCSRWELPTVPFHGREQHVPEEDSDSEEEILPNRDKVKHKIRFKQALDDIREERFFLSYLPKKLCGTPDNRNMLELMPKEIVQLITQMVCFKKWEHARSFYVPLHHTDDSLVKSEDLSLWLPTHKNVSINFIDGKPDKLEIALRLRHNKKATNADENRLIDAIVVNTHNYDQTIERGKFNSTQDALPISYVQRGIETGPVIPLRQQLNFIDYYNTLMFSWSHDNSVVHTNSRGPLNYGYSDYSDPCGKELMELGIQRNLLGGRTIWLRARGNKVGIYEKAMPWYDENGGLAWPGFESVLKDRDPDGDEYHLVQVIEESVPVRTVSLPHTPVYLKDKDGNEIEECCTRPSGDSTAHLRSPLDYPQDLDAFALGFSCEETNARASLYKQLGWDLKHYHPSLLLHQGHLVPSRKKELLYSDEHPSLMQRLHYGRISAQAWIAYKRGLRKTPVSSLPLE